MFCIHRNHLLSAFAAGILWKTQPWGSFARIRTAKCIASCNHDGSFKDNYCPPFFKLKFLIPTLRHLFCSPKPSKSTEKVTSKVSFRELSRENIHFLWFQKKRLIFLMGGIYKCILPKKYFKFFSSGYYFPLYISPLMDSRGLYITYKKTHCNNISFVEVAYHSV